MKSGNYIALALLLAGCAAPTATPASTPEPTPTINPFVEHCPVTLPAEGDQLPSPDNDFTLGNADNTLFTIPWPDGVVTFEPDGPGFSEDDGSLTMKWPWYRGVPGQVTISGKRLDAPALPLRYEAGDGYGEKGFQPSYLIFPTEGCWEVTGVVADASLTFVTLVVNNRD